MARQLARWTLVVGQVQVPVAAVIAQQVAMDRACERLQEAAARRAARAARPDVLSWRARQARHLLALARRLDPSVDRRAAPRAAAVR